MGMDPSTTGRPFDEAVWDLVMALEPLLERRRSTEAAVQDLWGVWERLSPLSASVRESSQGAPLRRPKGSSPIAKRQRRKRSHFIEPLGIFDLHWQCARRFQTGLADFLGALDNGGMLRIRRDGGTGRRSRLKICWGYPRAGSSPAPGTTVVTRVPGFSGSPFCFLQAPTSFNLLSFVYQNFLPSPAEPSEPWIFMSRRRARRSRTICMAIASSKYPVGNR